MNYNFNEKQMEILMIVKDLGLKLAMDGKLDFDEILMELYHYRKYCNDVTYSDYGKTIIILNNKANDGDLSNPDEILLPILKVIKNIKYDDCDDGLMVEDYI